MSLNGQIFVDNEIIDYEQIVNKIVKKEESDLEKYLDEANGFYSVIVQDATTLIAVVDIVSSIPLFYSLSQGKFYISDDAEWVRKQVGNTIFDSIPKEEFQLTGFVTGKETLFPDVKQLQAGEYLKIDVIEEGLRLNLSRYYTFSHNEPKEYHEGQLRKELECVTENVIKRLIEYTNGRQLVLPLSGGYDSRLIASKLYELGYENVITFTYGIPGNKDSQVSKSLAESLNFDWHFVEYNEDKWKEAWASGEFWEYMRFATNWRSIGHVQDWLAVKELKNEGILNDHSIFVPGHSGDFVAGSHIPDEVFVHKSFKKDQISQALFEDHYNISPSRVVTQEQFFGEKRIQKQITLKENYLPWEFADNYERWDWQERQAKFICNSIRVYEYFGYDFWLPLWDKEFVEFWERIPLKLRQERKWYNEFVDTQYKRVSLVASSGYANPKKSKLKKILLEFVPYNSRNAISEYLNKLKKLFSYNKNRILLNGIVGTGYLKTKFLLSSGYKPLGIITKEFIRKSGDNEY